MPSKIELSDEQKILIVDLHLKSRLVPHEIADRIKTNGLVVSTEFIKARLVAWGVYDVNVSYRLKHELRKRKQSEATRQKKREIMKARYAGGWAPPFLGRKHSDDTRTKMASSGTSAWAQKTDEEYDSIVEKIAESRRGMVLSREHRSSISDAMRRQIISGERKTGRGLKSAHKSPKAGTVFCRSAWENRFFALLDADDNVAQYEVEPFSVKYEFDGCQRNYIPDVLLLLRDGTLKLVEIKPQYMLRDLKTQYKLRAAEIYCENAGIVFEVATEREYPSIRQQAS